MEEVVDLTAAVSPQPHKRAKMVQAACDTCRKQKRKCDGNFPCARCLNLGKECSYSPQKPRGAKRRLKKEEEDGSVTIGNKECPSHFASVHILEDCLKQYEFHMQPFLYAIELDSLKKSDAHASPEKQLLLLSILVNGAFCAENVKLARCLAREVEVLLADKFCKSTSLVVCQALYLLSIYYTRVGESDKAHVLDFSVYRITRKFAKANQDAHGQERLLTFLQVRSLTKLVCLSTDEDDSEHYFNKARKLTRCPIDTTHLIVYWCKHQIANAYAGNQWNSEGIFALLNEADELIAKGAKCTKTDFVWIMQMFQALILAIRSAALYNIGEVEKALEHADMCISCIQKQEPCRKMYGYDHALCFVFKLWIDTKQTEKIREFHPLLERQTRHLLLEKGEDVAVLISYLTSSNLEKPVPSTLQWISSIVRPSDDEGSSPTQMWGSSPNAQLLADDERPFSVEDFLSLGTHFPPQETAESDALKQILDTDTTDQLFSHTSNMFPFDPPAFESEFPPIKREDDLWAPPLDGLGVLDLGTKEFSFQG